MAHYKDLFNLTGKVALITGGAGGLGQIMGLGLAEYGAQPVIFADYNLEGAKRAAAAVVASGYQADAVFVDVTSKPSVDSMVDKVSRQYGRIDILINSAGVNNRKPAIEYTEDEYDHILDINLKGTFLCCQAVGKIMLAQQKGKIINMGSVSSVLGHPHHGPYAASKGGVALLTRVLAVEWAKNGINVNAICPAYIRTPLTEGYLSTGNHYEQIVKTIPMGRLGMPSDLVGAAVYLASPASDFVTGTLLLVDGGRTAD
ncbi:MAG TPA: glucose 1-dehydrogenase [Firmicutes bacterium]|nr:glucose 1-dehydrogenase [Bacillota bacterium]